jgi:alpha-1,2-mannosyltransferase
MREEPGPIAGALLLSVATATGLLVTLEWVRGHTDLTWLPGDLSVYREAARAVLSGGSPYQVAVNGYGFAYPPFAALVFAPLGWLGRAAGYWSWTLATLVSLQAVTWLLLGRLGVTDRRRRSALLPACTLALLPLSPIAGTLLLGNVNILLMVLVLADLLWVKGRYRGILIGVAAGIKLTPLIFVPYLLLTGRVRAGMTVLLSFAGTVGIGVLLLPGPSLTFWGGALFDSSRTRPPGEQAFGSSIRGAVLGLLPDALAPVWLPASLAVGVAGIALAVRASRRGEELLGIVVVAVTGLLVSPVTWYAHWVWCVPVLALAAARLDRDRLPARTALAGLWLVFAIPLPWWLGYLAAGRPFPERAWVAPTELLYLLTGASLLVLAAAWLRPVSVKGAT